MIETSSFDDLVARARRLTRHGRRILGITGAPGAGKSTLAKALIGALDGRAVDVPMDGFHLANDELDRLGRRGRKGAPDTFDAAAYISTLRRLKENNDEVVYAPAFRRELDEPIAAAIAVSRDVPLVVTEGNYLLVDDFPWAALRGFLDEVWYLELSKETRNKRLVDRHVRYGKSLQAAREWVEDSDELNAALVVATRDRADVIVRDWTQQ
jgi:pantothenate kinase